MKIKDYRTEFIEELTPLYDAMEAESFFYMILDTKKQMRKIDLALNPDLVFSEDEIALWNDIRNQLKQLIPVQYILGKTNFFGLEFEVNEDTLIPRPETEELVDWILSGQNKAAKLKILDIGTGSGCIAIALAKKLPNASVSAIDVSTKALEVAKRNANANQVHISFIHQDILETTDLKQEFDIIVSNPPYVRHLEKEEIKQNVLDYEPHMALFVEDDDALIFYRKIADLAQKNLSKNGLLYFEINQYLGNETVDLLAKMPFSAIELRKDIYENDRMIKVIK